MREKNNTNLERMRELIERLTEADIAYYKNDAPIMTDLEYDRLTEELAALEHDTGLVLSGSPTQKVSGEILESLAEVRHTKPMLSAGKTKSIEDLIRFAAGRAVLLSWKMDGLTLVLRYEYGKLKQAITRGREGIIGEDVTHTVRTFRNVPLTISTKESFEVRGEGVISWESFRRINASLEEPYTHPRNLASGSTRKLDAGEASKRRLEFWAFELVSDHLEPESKLAQQQFLQCSGFSVVPYIFLDAGHSEQDIRDAVAGMEPKDFAYPVDGLVMEYEDLRYGKSLGATGHHENRLIALKWADELYSTRFRGVELATTRTGMVSITGLFDPISIDGTLVSRAYLHNLDIFDEFQFGIGDEISVYKANMIIPQIAENLTRSGVKDIPERCPVCQGETKIRQVGNAKALYCMNPECQAKHVKAFALFVSRDALNIEGLSEATLEKFISRGYIHTFADIFHLDRYKDEIQGMEGFGEKSYRKLIESVEKARTTTLPRVVYSLGIAGIGLANAKVICRELKYDVEALLMVTEEELNEIQGVGEVLAKAFTGYFSDAKHVENFRKLLEELTILEETSTKKQIFEGVNFVITGSVTHFANRGEVKELIESLGGKVTGSVTSKTNYLINNDVTSTSSKNKKANELGIPIISEETFLELVNQEES